MPKLVDHTTYSRPSRTGARRPLRTPDFIAYRAFLRAHAAVIRRIEAALAGAPLSLSELDVLAALADAPTATLRMVDLADRVLLTKSGMTRLVDRLVERGFVERTACPTDRRQQHAVMTSAGRGALRRTARAHLLGIAEAFAAHIEPAERETLTRALDRVAAANGAAAPGHIV